MSEHLTPSPEHFALMHNALDHIARTARKSRTSTRRLRWIEERANDAIAGRAYTPVDLPKDGGPDTAEKLKRKLSEAMAERDQLRAFAQDIMDEWPDVGTLDGFDLQELAVKHGLLAETTHHKPCAEEGCNCASMVDGRDWQEGVQCYRGTPLLKGIVV